MKMLKLPDIFHLKNARIIYIVYIYIYIYIYIVDIIVSCQPCMI